jgi:hypothetical protein
VVGFVEQVNQILRVAVKVDPIGSWTGAEAAPIKQLDSVAGIGKHPLFRKGVQTPPHAAVHEQRRHARAELFDVEIGH